MATDGKEEARREEEDIKTMQLYSDVDRIDSELGALGIPDGASIDPYMLSKFDSMHYEGNDAIRAAIAALDVQQSSRILDIGSGFGGPARFLALATKCNAIAMELQNDIHSKAAELTRRCNLDHLVKHMHGNFLECDPSTIGEGAGTFDGVVSWLVFLHIKDKHSLLKKCAIILKDGSGKLFADDFFMLKPFTEEEHRSLKDDVYCSDLPTREEYIDALKSCGFHNINFEDRTAQWSEYCNDRLGEFVASRERYERVHGVAAYKQLLHFYKAMAVLFKGGHLGGVRLYGEKKGDT